MLGMPSAFRTNRHCRNPERHGCRNRRPRSQTHQSPPGQAGHDVRVADGEGEVGMSMRQEVV
jgi:hypothetical protein